MARNCTCTLCYASRLCHVSDSLLSRTAFVQCIKNCLIGRPFCRRSPRFIHECTLFGCFRHVNWKEIALSTGLFSQEIADYIGLGLQVFPKLYGMYRKSPSPDAVNSGNVKIAQHSQVWYQIEALSALNANMATGVRLPQPWWNKRSFNF